MQDLIGILGLGGYGLALLAAVYALLPKKGSLENQMIDQLQERIESLEKTSGEQDKKIDVLYSDLSRLRRRDIAWERYVAQMQTGVERGIFPPWPERIGILAEAHHD